MADRGARRPAGPFVVSGLSVTPVKGLALHHPRSVELDAGGARGDRDFLLADPEGRMVSVTKTGALLRVRAGWDPVAEVLVLHDADGTVLARGPARGGEPVAVDLFGLRDVPGRIVGGPFAAVLSRLAGRPLRLVRTDVPGAASDVHPVTLLGDASVAALAATAGVPEVDRRRFRMLIAFSGGAPYAEEAWAGRELRVGGAVLRIGGTVPRCAATTRHPERGDRDFPVVRLLKEERGLRETGLGRGVPFGVYAEVLEPGRVAVGDELVPRGAGQA